MDLNRLVKDLEEIKGCIEDNYIEKAEDLLSFVISEISIAAQHSVQADGACACPDNGNLQINSDFVCAVCGKTPRR